MRRNFRTKTEVIVLLVYLLYLIILTTVPFEFSLPSEVQYGLIEDTSISNFVLNMFLFIPFGFLLFSLIGNVNRKGYIKVIICGVLGIILSFIIETYQLFLPRGPEMIDIFANATGSVLGALLARHYYSKVVGVIRYSWLRVQKSTYLLAIVIVLYSAAVFTLSVLPIQSVDFGNWDQVFTFQIGNEPTFSRPWIGKIYLVGVYNSSLSDREVEANYKAGPYSSNGTRIKDGLIAFYNFEEGSGEIIHDSSDFGKPLNLKVYDPSRIRWLAPNGLEILDNTIIRSQDSAKKLYSAIKPANEFSVEAWVAPSSVSQRGPARIVSFSKDWGYRNFTLGQEEKNIHFRVRTPLSGLNGTDINLETDDRFVTTEVQHLVATYGGGIETLFVNGVKHSSLNLFHHHTTPLLPLGFYGNNVLYKLAFCFFFFLPLNLLFYTFFLNRFGKFRSSMLSVLLSFGLLSVIAILYALLLSMDFDFTLLLIVLLVSAFTTIFCSTYDKFGIFHGDRVNI